jgi:hypothetical protein
MSTLAPDWPPTSSRSVSPREHLAAGHSRHPLIGYDERHLLAGGLHRGKGLEASLWVKVRHHSVVAAEPARERVEQRAQRHRLVVEDHDRRPVRHLPSRARTARVAPRHGRM